MRTFNGHTEPITGVAFAPDGQTLASSSRDHTIRLWRREDGTAMRPLAGPAEIFCLVFTPHGDRILSGTWEGATLWDVASANVVRTFGDHVGPVLAVAVATDGQSGATAGEDHVIRIWSLDEGRSLRTLEGHAGRVNALAWLADGSRLLSGARTGRFASGIGTRVSKSRHSQAPALRSTASRSCRAVAALAGYHDGTVRVWTLPTPGRCSARTSLSRS